MDNWIYLGIFFNQNERNILLNRAEIPEGWKVYCDHMTIVFNDKSDKAKEIAEKYRFLAATDAREGTKYKLTINGIGKSDKAMAFRVCDFKTNNAISHITIATSPDGKPVESNNITKWNNIEPFTVEGELKFFRRH